MRHSALLLFVVACSSPSSEPPREARPQTTQEAVRFAPADALGVAHLDLQAALRLVKNPRIEQELDQLAQIAPGCDRALLKTIETVTIAFRSLDRPGDSVVRLRGPIERAALQKCLEGLAAYVKAFTVAGKDKDLVLGDTAGAELLVATWQDGGVLIGPRADLARTAGPEKPGIRNAINLIPRPDVAAWLVMDRTESFPGPITFHAVEEDGIRAGFGVRHDDTSTDVQTATRQMVDDMIKGFLQGAVAKGAAFDEQSLRQRVQITVSERWGLVQARWTTAEVADFSRRLAEAMGTRP